MKIYHDYLRHIIANGVPSGDRTGTGTISTFGYEMRFDLQKGFPLVTTKKVSFKSVASEMLWFLSGSTNVKDLHAMGNHIWDPWADENGELGPVYGKQWVDWIGPQGESINQVKQLIQDIRTNPTSRRLMVSAWNVGEIKDMALPPCHLLMQFRVHQVYDHLRLLQTAKNLDGADRIRNLIEESTDLHIMMPRITRGIIERYGDAIDESAFCKKTLSCTMTIRSSDAFIGMPYNIAEYALLLHMIAHQTALEVGELIIHVGDAHIYSNHVEQVNQILTRTPHPLPRLRMLRLPESIFDYTLDDFELVNYVHEGAILAPVAV